MPCRKHAAGAAFNEHQYWDEQYSEFEHRVLRSEVFWRAPAHLLQGTQLFTVFERLCAAFPDHPDDRNTVFYLIDHASYAPKTHSVLLRCSHFEHTSLDDIRTLAEFLDFASDTITTEKSAGIDALDDYKQELQIRFYSPRDDVISILQERSSKMAEQYAAPNDGPAAPPDSSGVTEGPPSVS